MGGGGGGGRGEGGIGSFSNRIHDTSNPTWIWNL